MSFALYQIVIIGLAIIMIGQGIKHFLKGESSQTVLKLAVRILVWGGMALVVAFPNVSNAVAKIIGIQDNINAVILAGFLLVFLMIFKILSAVERLEQQLTTLTRQKTLEKIGEINTEKISSQN